jgi:hypothetical protein
MIELSRRTGRSGRSSALTSAQIMRRTGKPRSPRPALSQRRSFNRHRKPVQSLANIAFNAAKFRLATPGYTFVSSGGQGFGPGHRAQSRPAERQSDQAELISPIPRQLRRVFRRAARSAREAARNRFNPRSATGRDFAAVARRGNLPSRRPIPIIAV